jgi:DNA-binding response OmpR family regulator
MDKPANSRMHVLVLEDEALIAINLQDELQDAGYEVAGPFTTCAAALSWLETGTPGLAILDAALNDGPYNDVADELGRRNIPFLIYSGHQESHSLLPDFQHVIWIEKPAPSAVLVQACHRLIGGSD